MPLDHGVRHDDSVGPQLKRREELPNVIEQPLTNHHLIAAIP